MQSKQDWIKSLRPHSSIKKVEKRGYAYLPAKLQEELGIREDKKARVPVFINANVLLLIRKGATKKEVLKGLKILVDDIDLRWKETEEK